MSTCPIRGVPARLLVCLLLVVLTRTGHGDERGADAATGSWPSFRGRGAAGVMEGPPAPLEWNVERSKNVRWKASIPGMGHSAPVVWGGRVFVTTAVIEREQGGDQKLKTGLYGDIGSVAEEADQTFSWRVLCLDSKTGRVLWERTARKGVPKVKRHPKSSHANPTPAVDGERVVAFFGSEGLYCYDLDGRPQWQKDFGVLDAGYHLVPAAQWGFASSPVLHDGKVIVQADVQGGGFVTALDAGNGGELWRTPRGDVPTWGTPTVHHDAQTGRTQVICNGHREIAGYEFGSGKKLWTMSGGGDIPVPTPVVADHLGLIFVTSSHGGPSPIYAIKTSAEGDITLKGDRTSNRHIAWSTPRGGNYMQTPIVVGDHLYACRDNGVLTCFDARTGRDIYRERLDGIGFTASPVASGDRLYFTSEDGLVHVVRAGPKFELLATNTLGAACLSTPAVADGVLYFRTPDMLIAVGSGVEQ